MLKKIIKRYYFKHFKFKHCKVSSDYVPSDISIDYGAVVERDVVMPSWSKIGFYSYINVGSWVEAHVGNYCSIGVGCQIGGGSHALKFVSTCQRFYGIRTVGYPKNIFGDYIEHDDSPKITQIGSDVWIGANAVVLGGITVGHGAVVGANAVVTKDVPPYAIVAGNPARIIRYRFAEDQIKWLLESRWWEKMPSELADFREYFSAGEKWWEFVKNPTEF